MKEYTHILWDWNGTLIDDLDMNIEIENLFLSERSLPGPITKEYYLDHFDFPIIDFYKKLGYDFSSESYQTVAHKYEKVYEASLPRMSLFLDAREAVEAFSAAGIKQAIISASEQAFLLRQVSRFGIEDSFIRIIGIDDNLGTGKTQRAAQWIASEGIDPAKVVFIGDTIHDRDSALAIGCDCFLVCGGHNSRRRLEMTGCKVFDSRADAARYVLGDR